MPVQTAKTSAAILCSLLLMSSGCSDTNTSDSSSDDGSSGGGATNETAPHTDDKSDEDGSGTNDDDWDDTDIESFDECAAVSEFADNTYGPVDIVFVIDNSPSMGDEIEEVRSNMNRFSKTVGDEGLDMNITLISCLPGDCDKDQFLGICIDPPVGAEGGCEGAGPYDDTKLPSYLHISDRVPSQKDLQWIINNHSEWRQMIRDDSVIHFVVISDDTDEKTAEWFNTSLQELDSRFAEYYFHGIFSYLGKEDACAISPSEPCCTYAAPGGEGTVYKELVALTEGISSDLCLQEFDPVFDELAGSVIGSAELACHWTIPAPPDGEVLDPDRVNIQFTDDEETSHLIGHAYSADECIQVENGWYYDDPLKPKMVHVCPQTCGWIQDQQRAKIILEFGCETEDAPVV